jgi:hypothetical protein
LCRNLSKSLKEPGLEMHTRRERYSQVTLTGISTNNVKSVYINNSKVLHSTHSYGDLTITVPTELLEGDLSVDINYPKHQRNFVISLLVKKIELSYK